MPRHDPARVDLHCSLDRPQMVPDRIEIWNAVLVQHGLRERDISAEEHPVDLESKLIWRMSGQRDHLDWNPFDLEANFRNYRVNWTRFGQQKSPTEHCRRIRSGVKQRRLQNRIANDRLIDCRGEHLCACSFYDGRIRPEVIRMCMRRDDRG